MLLVDWSVTWQFINLGINTPIIAFKSILIAWELGSNTPENVSIKRWLI